jgi:hypothetical protein
MFVDAVREYHTANRGVAELHVPLAALRERVRAESNRFRIPVSSGRAKP